MATTKRPPRHLAAALGRRLAQQRKARGLTLNALSETTKLSAPYISQLEGGLANPTLSVLACLASQLDMTVGELFGAGTTASPTFSPRIAPLPAAALAPGTAAVWDLSAQGSSHLAPRLVHGPSPEHAAGVRHEGEEFLMVLAGTCRIRVDDVVKELRQGDSCHLAASQFHQVTAHSEDCLMLVVIGGARAR